MLTLQSHNSICVLSQSIRSTALLVAASPSFAFLSRLPPAAMSFFHKMKKAVVGKKEEAGSASLCPEYDTIRVEFEALHDVMLRIRQHLLTYREANSRLWTASTSLSTEFANMLSEANPLDGEHPYTTMASTMKQSHNALPAERERLDTMLNACLFPLKEQLAKYEELKVRMVDHDKQKDEVVYYQGKVNSLRTAREQSKKAESAADKDKYDRNIRKMQEQETAFQAMDMQLTAELRYAYEHRVAVLGPIMLAFVLAEKQMAASYTQAIQGVQLVDVNEANAWLAKHEAAMAAKAVNISTISSTRTVVTDLQSPNNRASVSVNTASTVSSAPIVLIPDVASLSHASTSGVVVSAPHFANGSTGSTIASHELPQSPSGIKGGFFDSFEPNFGADSATAASSAPYSDPFASIATESSTSASTTTHTSSTTATAGTLHDSTAAAVDGVPYTIGSASSHYASSLAASHPSTASTISTASTSTSSIAPATASTSTTVTATSTTHPANGTTSTFPIEESLLNDTTTLPSTTTVSSTTGEVTAPAVAAVAATAVPTTAHTAAHAAVPAAALMDDMALEKTRGAEQLDAVHGGASGVTGSGVVGHVEKTLETHEPNIKSDVGDATTFGAGEKTDLYGAPVTATTTTTTTAPSHIV